MGCEEKGSSPSGRAGIVSAAEDYPWSSATPHLAGEDPSGLLDMEWWRNEAPAEWRGILHRQHAEPDSRAALRACTYAGRPFGGETFLSEMSVKFGRQWNRPEQSDQESDDSPPENQLSLFLKNHPKKETTQIRLSPQFPRRSSGQPLDAETLTRSQAHLTGHDESGILDMEWWQRERHANWEQRPDGVAHPQDEARRACTHAGRPFGSEDFLRQMAEQFDRHWTRGRPKKKSPARTPLDPSGQLSLF